MDELQQFTHVDQIHSLAEIHRRGERAFDPGSYAQWLDDRQPHDLASIVYTSGTTGKPKGVTLTHANIRANVNQLRKRAGPRPDKPDDVTAIDAEKTTISVLPLAHIYERTTGHFFAYASGCTVGYAESTDTVAEDIQTIEPHGGTSVPLVYERIFEQMREQASDSDLKQRIFNWAVDIGREAGRTSDPGIGLRVKHRLADTLVFRQVREELGGNIVGFFSGGGSLDPDLAALFNGMGIPIYEGYGLTEASPVVTVNPPEDLRPGTLGPPLPDVDIRIDPTKVSDEQFADAEGVVGELVVKGPNVTSGYWGLPEQSEDSFTPEGYFRTGDVVERTQDGYLIYHDRLKNLLVLSTGKNVAPVPIEKRFSTSSRVEQIMVMGDDEKFVSALIVPNFEAVWRWASNRGIDLPDTKIGVCMNDRVREWISEDVELVNRNFESHETIKRFELVPTEWTPENDLLTPSLKKKRHNIVEEHDDRVAAIYDDEAEVATADD
jgi:long-chain acyl-CoA synthetase